MNNFDERVRGERARQIIEDEIFKESVSRTQDQMIQDLINIDAFDPDAPTMALRGVMRIQALSFVLQNVNSVMVTGQIAAEEDADG